MRIAEGGALIGLQTVESGAEILTVTAGGFGKRTPEDQYPTKGRHGKGIIGHKVTDVTGPVVGMAVVRGDEELVVISTDRQDAAHRGAAAAPLRPLRLKASR